VWVRVRLALADLGAFDVAMEVVRKSFGDVVGYRELITIEPAWRVGLGAERRSRDVWADMAPRTFADATARWEAWDIL
jgi:hypothetical protein